MFAPGVPQLVPKNPPNCPAGVSNVYSATPPALPKRKPGECGKMLHMKPQPVVTCAAPAHRSAVLLNTRPGTHGANPKFGPGNGSLMSPVNGPIGVNWPHAAPAAA